MEELLAESPNLLPGVKAGFDKVIVWKVLVAIPVTKYQIGLTHCTLHALVSRLWGGWTALAVLKPSNNGAITIGQINKRYKNNDSDRYQQFTFDPNTTATYLINSSGDLVRRINHEGGQTSITDDFDTFESSASVNTTTYQSAV